MPQTATPLLDAFTFDLTRSMKVTYPGRLTDHPAQSGASINDFYIVDPPIVQVSGIVANTPVTMLAGSRNPAFGAPPITGARINGDRMTTLRDLLVQLHDLGIVVTVLSSWNPPLYNYIAEVIDTSRDANSGNTIPVTVNFKDFRIVESLTVPAVQDSDILALGQSTVEFGPVSFE